MTRMNPRTILVRAPNWIGDQILAFPFFYYLRKCYPAAKITSVCVEWVKDLQFKDLVDVVYVLERSFKGSIFEKFGIITRAADELRKKEKFDLAITLPNSISSAWLVYRLGAVQRRGYRVEGRGILLNDGLKWDSDPERHRAQAYADLLPECKTQFPLSNSVKDFWGIPGDSELDEPIPGETISFDWQKSWNPEEVVEPPEGDYWVLAPGSTAESRRWPLEYMIQFARLVAREKKWQGIIVGGSKEAFLASQLCEDRSLKLTDLTAQGPVSGLSKVFRNAKFTLTNESGLAHVASLCSSFVQIVCGAADPRRTRPLGPGKVQVAINPVDCWPCERNQCAEQGGDRLKCLRGIKAEAVWEEIKLGLRR